MNALNKFLDACASDCIDQGDQVARVVRAMRSHSGARLTIHLDGVAAEISDDGDRFTAICGRGLNDRSMEFLSDVALRLGYDRTLVGAEVTDDGRDDLWWTLAN